MAVKVAILQTRPSANAQIHGVYIPG